MDAVGSYQLLRRVSAAGPYPTWQGRSHATARYVSLTRIGLTTLEPVDRFRRQARLLRGISHPAIVEVLEVFEDRDHAWLVEEWVNGDSLAAVLDRGDPLSTEQVVGVIDATLAALEHAHQHALVHGNINARNVLIDVDGAVRLTDFGPDPGPDRTDTDTTTHGACNAGHRRQPRGRLAQVAAGAPGGRDQRRCPAGGYRGSVAAICPESRSSGPPSRPQPSPASDRTGATGATSVVEWSERRPIGATSRSWRPRRPRGTLAAPVGQHRRRLPPTCGTTSSLGGRPARGRRTRAVSFR